MIWAFIEWLVVRVLLPFTTLFLLLCTLMSFWIGHAVYAVVFFAAFVVLALIWAHEHRAK